MYKYIFKINLISSTFFLIILQQYKIIKIYYLKTLYFLFLRTKNRKQFFIVKRVFSNFREQKIVLKNNYLYNKKYNYFVFLIIRIQTMSRKSWAWELSS